MKPGLLSLLCLCAPLLAAAQRPVVQAPPAPSGLYGSLFGNTGTPAVAPPSLARRSAPSTAAAPAAPAPRAAVAPEVGTLTLVGINVKNDHKLVRSPLIVMDVGVEQAPPTVVEMPNVLSENTDYPCARTGAQLPTGCALGDVRPGNVVSVRVVEARGNVTLLPPRSCRFFYEDLLPKANATQSAAAAAPSLRCASADVASLTLSCRGCRPAAAPVPFATLQRVRLENALPRGRAVLACSAPSSGPFLLALPAVSDAKVDYACADTGASSCRLARIAPGERIACAVLDARSLNKPGTALLQASACAPTADDLRVRPFDCQSAAVRITLGCENCG